MTLIARLRNPILTYAWGSRTALADLLGRSSPAAQPEAELWMGAHPNGTSLVETPGGPVPLDRFIAADPETILGARVVRGFGPRLPFLFKVLAAARPLSLQVHPDAEQARTGYEREERLGIPHGAAERNYSDRYPKPELVCALSRFALLSGFRPPAEVARALHELGLHPLPAPLLPLERVASSGASGATAALFLALLRLPHRDQALLAERACAHAAELLAQPQAGERSELRWLMRLAQDHPSQSGVLAPLLLNLVELRPGQAVFTGPRVIHSYLEGTAVELMASSDNVLRGGLTRKHVDVEELSRVLRRSTDAPEILAGQPRASASGPPEEAALCTHYPAPATEFELERLALDEGARRVAEATGSVEIALCTRGQFQFAAAGDAATVHRGDSLIVAAAAGRYEITGAGELFVARVPPPADR